MRNRSGGKGSQPINDLNPDLQELLKGKLTKLGQQYSFTAVIAVPSTTWAQRTTVITLLAKLLNIPAYPNLLTWNPQPESRQGTLHNNDQRKQNVKQKMSLRESLPSQVVRCYC